MKKSVKLVIAVVVLLAAVGIFWGVQNKGPKDEAEETEYITAADSGDIYKYSYTNDGKVYTFTCDSEDGWSYDGDKDFNLDGSKLSVVIQNLWKTSIVRTLEDTDEESFEEFGLSDPAGEITVTMKDGSTETFHIGNTNSTVGAVYLYENDDTSTVYLVSTDISSAYNKSLDSLEGTTSITQENAEESAEE